MLCQSQWLRGLRSRFVADHLLRLWVWIPLGALTLVCCECCVLSGRALCNELIIRPEWILPTAVHHCVWSRNFKNEEALALWGLLCQKKRICWYIISINGFATMLPKRPSNHWSAVSEELLIHNTYKCWRIKCTAIILALKMIWKTAFVMSPFWFHWQNFTVQWATCLLGLCLWAEGNRFQSKNVLLSAVQWTKMYETPHTTNWNSANCCTACHLAQWFDCRVLHEVRGGQICMRPLEANNNGLKCYTEFMI